MFFNFGAVILLLSGLIGVSAFKFPDFDVYKESLSTMNAACSMFARLVEWIDYDEPEIENVLFQLRTACYNLSVDVTDTAHIRSYDRFNSSQPTVVFVAGWRSHMDSAYIEHLTKAYNCRGGYNLIVVNTSGYIRTEYITSAYNTEKLGQFVAVGLKNLNLPGKDIHLIGHSLGAHIMGTAARTFSATTGDKIGRITGLDPARPCYFNHSTFYSLNRNDATFVDIIHSNPGELGLESQVGHVDFFPGGLDPQQAACYAVNIACSHIMSIDYYTETVYPGNEMNFMADKCGNYTDLQALNCHGQPEEPMGFAVNEKATGIYLLKVNENSPYGMNATIKDYQKTMAECGICQE